MVKQRIGKCDHCMCLELEVRDVGAALGAWPQRWLCEHCADEIERCEGRECECTNGCGRCLGVNGWMW